MKSQVLRLLAVTVALLVPVAVQAQDVPVPQGPTAADLLNSEVVRDLKFFIHSSDWTKLQENFLSNTYYPCDVHWEGEIVRNVGIRSRGRGSRSPIKPGLRVDFDRYSTKQAFLGLKSVILDNLTQDPSMMREVAIMRFFQRMGQPASREAFVRLWVNNQYVGLYGLVESIDKDFLRRSFGQVEEDWEDDGYLYEYDYKADYRFEYLGPELEKYAEIFDPKTHEKGSDEELYRYFEELIRLANEVSDSDFVSVIGQRLDLTTFVKHLALESFVAELDGFVGYAGMNNFYFYRMEHTGLGRPIVWDKDVAFYAIDFPIFNGIETNVLTRRVLAIPEMKALFLQTLAEAAASAMEPELPPVPSPVPQLDDPEPPKPGWLEREITRLYTLIREHAHADANKPFDNERFEDEVSKILLFTRERSGFVVNEVAKELPQQ